MSPSTRFGSGYASVSVLCLVFLALSGPTLANSILAFAPVTALASLEGLNVRQLAGSCPAATQTPCADGLGCCPNGAACTYSRDVPVCDEACNGGPNCPNGGCCQVGYVCGSTNNFCSPATKPTQAAPAAPAPGNKQADEDIIITATTSPTTPPSAPLHANPTPGADDLLHSNDSGVKSSISDVSESTTGPAKTPTVPSSRHPVPSPTSTTSYTRSGTNTKYVAGGTGAKKSPSPSAQATSTGAAYSIEARDSLLTAIFGWVAGIAVMI